MPESGIRTPRPEGNISLEAPHPSRAQRAWVAHDGWSEMEREAKTLPIEQKCRLALLLWLALPLNNDREAHYRTLIGPQAKEVADPDRLSKIDPAVLDRICTAFGYPPGRATALEQQVKIWGGNVPEPHQGTADPIWSFRAGWT
jgi:hypothetical protein